MNQDNGIILLAIRGTLVPKTIEQSRQVHNATAGDERGVAAAKALGDLSHNVYVPLGAREEASELLILDRWTDPAGVQKFFSSPDVQAGGGKLFSARDSALWTAATDCAAYALPSPKGKDERFVGLIRATVKSRSAAAEAFNSIVKSAKNVARRHGQISHEVFYRLTPGEESLELLGVDTWMDGDGMASFYADAGHLAPLRELFTAPPAASTWQQPPGSWVEW